MLQGTAVAGVITIVDLFGAAKIVSSRRFVPFESFLHRRRGHAHLKTVGHG